MREEVISQPLILRLTTIATQDLAEIWSYVAAEASEATATRLITKIRAALDNFLHFPQSGADRTNLAKGLRVGFSGIYAIYYQHSATELTIVRMLHSARDAVAIFSNG